MSVHKNDLERRWRDTALMCAVVAVCRRCRHCRIYAAQTVNGIKNNVFSFCAVLRACVCVRVSLFSYYFPLSRFIFLSFRSSDHSSAVFRFSFVYFFIHFFLSSFRMPQCCSLVVRMQRTRRLYRVALTSQMLNCVHACEWVLCAHTITMKSIHISRKRFDAIHFCCFVYALCSVPLLRSQFHFSTSVFVSNLLFVFSISNKNQKRTLTPHSHIATRVHLCVCVFWVHVRVFIR